MWLLWLVIVVFLVFGLVVFRGAPYVPTKRKLLDRAFKELYPLSKKDLLVDIGSGDGIVLRTAARHGARAIGYEINPLLVLVSWLLSRRHPEVTTVLADFWFVKLPRDTTIVYAFSESRDIAKMARRIQSEANRLGKTLYFMSNSFEVPNLKPVGKGASHLLYKFRPLHRK